MQDSILQLYSLQADNLYPLKFVRSICQANSPSFSILIHSEKVNWEVQLHPENWTKDTTKRGNVAFSRLSKRDCRR